VAARSDNPARWNKDLDGREPSVGDLKFDNFFKEIYLDSDTKVALLTNAPSDALRTGCCRRRTYF